MATAKTMNTESVLMAMLTGVVTLAVGWILASRNKVGKAEFDGLEHRLRALEAQTVHYVTRADLKEANKDLQDHLRDMIRAQAEKFDVALKALINEVRGRSRSSD